MIRSSTPLFMDISADLVRGFLRHVEERRADHSLLLFLYNTGARASEAAAITTGDLDERPDGSGSVRLLGKGGKTRHCPLWPTTMRTVWALTRGRRPDEAVFLNRRRRPMTRFAVHATVTRCAALAAVSQPSLAKKTISPHLIRHYVWFPTMLGEAIFAANLLTLEACQLDIVFVSSSVV